MMKSIAYVVPSPIADEASFTFHDIPTPKPGPQDLLVRVRAVSVNPIDYKIRASREGTADQPVVLGWDAAGVVEAVGAKVTGFKAGDEVWYAGDLNRAGSNAELQTVDHRIVSLKPRSLGFAEAAAMPLTTLTAWEGLFDRLKVDREQTGVLLVVGGAGGVGSMVIQLARRLTALSVVATVSRPETEAWVRDLGAHHVIDHRRPLSEALAELGLGQADHVYVTTQTEHHWPEVVATTKPQGSVLLIERQETLEMGEAWAKSLTVAWELMYTRSMYETDDIGRQGEILAEVAWRVDTGELRTTARTHLGPLTPESLREAHRLLESGTTIGKITLDGLG